MAMFKSDSQGFLVGELIENGRDVLKIQQQGMTVWKAIRADVKGIARALNVQVSNTVRASRPGTVTPSRSTASRSSWGAVSTPSRSGGGGGGRAQASAPASRGGYVRNTVAVVTPQRAANGRFVAGQGSASNGPSAAGGASGNAMMTKLSGTMDKISQSLQATDNIDPTVNAAREIKDVVAPLGRGLFSLFGKSTERKKETWYRRILKVLTSTTKAGEKTQSRVGFFGFGGGESGGARGGLFGAAGGLLVKGKGLLGRGAGLLKRVPILGALLSGGLALGSSFGLNDDPTKSDEENRTTRFRSAGEAAGMGIGGIAGAALGSFLGPLGTIGGGYLGSLIGEKVGGAVGDWSKQLMDSDVPAKMLAKWDAVTTALGTAWQATTKKAGEVWNGAKSIAGAGVDAVKVGAATANAAVKNATGKDAGEWAGVAGSAAKTAGAAMVPETVKRAASAVAGAAGTGISKILQTGAGFNVTQNADGSVTRQDGARNWRNHNPGNIEAGDFATKHGAIGSDGRFAIFPDYMTGRAAKEALIFDGKNYKDKTLTDAISRYAPPSENNTPAYQAAVLGAVSGQNKKMGDYTPTERAAIMNAMQRIEGFKVGKVSTIQSGMVPSATVATVNIPAMPHVNVPSSVPTNIPPLPDTPAHAQKLNSSTGSGRGIVVNVPSQLGQNVGDRQIAHIVSGGLGGS